ncbi:hypothetical protein Patl1_20646 [Pistacia atlantica]|uniref:Uncharacterized protein n=1 Tax=Pistacia atlantica TaxID=434234 RepID=A0ACC1BMJ2_9ROSI|nr:hypothetical protein Patl1_20646 [Pistacia atlantica]
MLPRCSGALSSLKYITHRNHFHGSAAAVAPAPTPTKQPLNTKQSKSIRDANVIYRRVVLQVDKPAIYVFNLEKTFGMTFALLVLHMWFVLRKRRGSQLDPKTYFRFPSLISSISVLAMLTTGVPSYEAVNLLLSKWMKEGSEKIFYGNIVAYDAAMLPEAKQDELQNAVTWVIARGPWVRNIFSDDGTSKPDDAALWAVQACIQLCFCHCVCHPCWMQGVVNYQFTHRAVVSFRIKQHTLSIIVAMTRYVRREVSCLSLTGQRSHLFWEFHVHPIRDYRIWSIEKVKWLRIH